MEIEKSMRIVIVTLAIILGLAIGNLFAQNIQSVGIVVTELEFAEQTQTNVSFEMDGQTVQATEPDVHNEINVRTVGILTVDTEADHVGVKARRSLFETAQVYRVNNNKFVIAGAPGKYLVEIDTFDDETGFDYRETSFEIPGDAVDDPGQQPDQPDTPDADFGELAKLAVKLANELNDEPTRSAIVTQLADKLPKMEAAETHNAAVDIFQASMTDVISNRQRGSLKKDWNGNFFRPLAKYFQDNIKNRSQFVAAWKAIYDAMSSQPASQPGPARIFPQTIIYEQPWTQPGRCYFNGRRWVCPNR